MSSCTPEEQNGLSNRFTLPRRYSVETNNSHLVEPKASKSFLPVKREECRSSEFSLRSSSIGAEPRCDNKFLKKPSRVSKSTSLREPKIYASKLDLQSPDSSISESISSYKDDSSKCVSDSSISRPYSKYSSEYLNSRYSPNKAEATDSNKTDVSKVKKISRFLRPDFYEGQKEENIYLRDKKEREMETQKVLKEIRDKRKGRLGSRREGSVSRDTSEKSEDVSLKESDRSIRESDTLLNKISDSIKTLENNNVHDYVNMPGASGSCDQNTEVIHDYVNVKSPKTVAKKEKVSRIARPKSYPAEITPKESSKEKTSISPEKESKLSKIRKGFTKNKDKIKEVNKNAKEEDKIQKNKLLHSLEKKLEKFRASKETQVAEEKKSTVENVIKRLREQSLPRNLDHCTESDLLKRAVSVEDLSGNKTIQPSRKSVTKILGLFKKYEEQEKKKTPKKPKNKVSKNDNDTDNEKNPKLKNDCSLSDSSEINKKERPKSLLIDKIKQYQNGTNEKDSKVKSKLPVNSYRRSLNLDNISDAVNNNTPTLEKPDRRNLKLDFSHIQSKSEPVVIREPTSNISAQEDSDFKENRNSFAMTDDSSTVLSPSDDYQSCDSWSVMSEYQNVNDLHSPLSPMGYLYSGDENESVIDRIRRKSFYTRFNEKKKMRKPNSYNLDLGYKDPADYSSLDRRNYGYRSSVSRRPSYIATAQEPTRSYRPYSRSSSLLNDYVNVPNRYQTYSSKIARPVSSLYSDCEDNYDDLLSAAKPRNYSLSTPPSRLGRRSVSPANDYYVGHSSSSMLSPNSKT